MALVNWETQLLEYEATGGQGMEDYTKRMTMLKILPKDLQDALLSRAMAAAMNYDSFRDLVTVRMQEMAFLNCRSPLNLAEEEDGEDDLDDETLAAAAEKRGWQVVRRSQPRPGNDRKAPSGATGASEMSKWCVNCWSKAHQTRECTKGFVPKEKKLCFWCEKPGHMGRDCPEKKRQSPPRRQDDRRGLNAVDDAPVETLVMHEEDAPSIRRGMTLGDFLKVSKNFRALADDDEDNATENDNEPQKDDSRKMSVCTLGGLGNSGIAKSSRAASRLRGTPPRATAEHVGAPRSKRGRERDECDRFAHGRTTATTRNHTARPSTTTSSPTSTMPSPTSSTPATAITTTTSTSTPATTTTTTTSSTMIPSSLDGGVRGGVAPPLTRLCQPKHLAC